MSLKISDLSEVAKMGKNQTVLSVTARVALARRPYPQSAIDEEYGWSRQLVELEDENGFRIPAIIYSGTMHLSSSNEGEVWRFRSINSDSGPRGITVNRWTPKGGGDEKVELKIQSSADMTRFAFANGKTQNEEIQKQEDPCDEPPFLSRKNPAPQTVKKEQTAQASGTESRVIADIEKFCREDLVLAPATFAMASHIAERQKMGVEKYGTTVEENNLSLEQWLNHAYEEKLDACVYLRRSIEQIDKERASGNPVRISMKKALIEQYKATINDALDLWGFILDVRRKEEQKPKDGEEPSKGDDDDGMSREDAVVFVAKNLRYNYSKDEISDGQRELGIEALSVIREFEIGYDEVYDTIVRGERNKNPDLIDRAFDTALQRIRAKNPGATSDGLCEAISKDPSTFRSLVEEVREMMQEEP